MPPETEYKYLAIKNWQKYNPNLKAPDRPAKYVIDVCDRDADREWSALSMFQRELLQGLIRLRGRFARNPHNDSTWIARALCVIGTDRPHLQHAIDTLIVHGFLLLSNQRNDAEILPIVKKSKEKKRIVENKQRSSPKNGELFISPNHKAFEKFWKAYPRKVGKAAAEKSWGKINPEQALIDNILASIEAHQRTEQWLDSKFIPHPATFLNQRRWEDEIKPQDDSKPFDAKLRRTYETIDKVCASYGRDEDENAKVAESVEHDLSEGIAARSGGEDS